MPFASLDPGRRSARAGRRSSSSKVGAAAIGHRRRCRLALGLRSLRILVAFVAAGDAAGLRWRPPSSCRRCRRLRPRIFGNGRAAVASLCGAAGGCPRSSERDRPPSVSATPREFRRASCAGPAGGGFFCSAGCERSSGRRPGDAERGIAGGGHGRFRGRRRSGRSRPTGCGQLQIARGDVGRGRGGGSGPADGRRRGPRRRSRSGAIRSRPGLFRRTDGGRPPAAWPARRRRRDFWRLGGRRTSGILTGPRAAAARRAGSTGATRRLRPRTGVGHRRHRTAAAAGGGLRSCSAAGRWNLGAGGAGPAWAVGRRRGGARTARSRLRIGLCGVGANGWLAACGCAAAAVLPLAHQQLDHDRAARARWC